MSWKVLQYASQQQSGDFKKILFQVVKTSVTTIPTTVLLTYLDDQTTLLLVTPGFKPFTASKDTLHGDLSEL